MIDYSNEFSQKNLKSFWFLQHSSRLSLSYFTQLYQVYHYFSVWTLLRDMFSRELSELKKILRRFSHSMIRQYKKINSMNGYPVDAWDNLGIF